jgi:hypothetical protein
MEVITARSRHKQALLEQVYRGYAQLWDEALMVSRCIEGMHSCGMSH